MTIDWLKTNAVQNVFKLLAKNGGEGHIVGGAVRDYLLNVSIGDIDFCSTHTPEQLIKLAQEHNIRSIETGIKYGTITLICEGQSFEVTSLREDVKTDGRHAQIAYGKTILEDAKRRDFTFNALYMTADGTILDPLGCGIDDAKTNTIKFIGNAGKRIKEDYLRILRYFRFIGRFGLNIDGTDYNQILPLVQGLDQLSAERIQAEFKHIFQSKHSVLAAELMQESQIFLQIFNMKANLEPLKYISQNHLNFNDKWLVQLALILPNTPIGEILKLSKREQKILKNLDTQIGDDLEKEIYKSGKKTIINRLVFHAASANSNADKLKLDIKFTEQFSIPTFPLKGQDLLEQGYKPSPEIGIKLKRLETLWLEQGFTPTKAELLRVLGDIRNAELASENPSTYRG